MFISNILKQKQANRELEQRLKQNIEATANLLRTVDTENESTAAIEAYERANQTTKPDHKKQIKFIYPEKTVEEADIEHHKNIHDQELLYRTQYQQWTERQARRGRGPPGEEIEEEGAQAPTYIKPTSNVIKVGDSHMEIKMEKQLNRETGTYEWVKQEMEILERPENNDINMEDNSITYEDKEKTKIDWETTLTNIKENGERLGYSKRHFLRCLLRIMNQNDDGMYMSYKEETCPERIANNLLSRYIGMNKKKLFENKLKNLTRTKGQPLREVMCQADMLADRVLQKCKDPQEKIFRKHQIMLDALKSFSSEENARELMQALRGSSLSGERPDIEELIDTVETAERINENSKPDKDRTFLNEKTAEKCEIFAVNPAGIPSSLESAIQKTKEMSIRGREERRSTQGNTEKEYSLFRRPSRERSNDKGRSEQRQRNQSMDRGSQTYNGPRERLRTPDRSMSRDRQSRRNESQPRGYNKERGFSRERRNFEKERGRNRERENYRPYEREGNREKSRERSDWRREQKPRDASYRSYEQRDRNNYDQNRNRENPRYRDNSRDNGNSYRNRPQNSGYNWRENSEDERTNRYRERDSSRSGAYRERDSSRSSRYNQRTGGYRERENSRTGRYNDRSQSRDRNSWKTVPQNKRNLEGVEFPPKTLMDLTVRFCVKCHNTLEEHYPWDCKLYRYWSNSPCEICYNGQHRAKECRKNPSRIDAFTVMLENPKQTNKDQTNPTFSPF